MTKADDGSINLKMPVLIALLSACLAVGSGGAWFASGSSTGVQSDALKADVAVLQQSVSAHHETDGARDARQDAQIDALEKHLERIEGKLDRLLARR